MLEKKSSFLFVSSMILGCRLLSLLRKEEKLVKPQWWTTHEEFLSVNYLWWRTEYWPKISSNHRWTLLHCLHDRKGRPSEMSAAENFRQIMIGKPEFQNNAMYLPLKNLQDSSINSCSRGGQNRQRVFLAIPWQCRVEVSFEWNQNPTNLCETIVQFKAALLKL